MGFGDVKLAGVLGLFLAWLGWPALIVGTFAPFLLGGAFAVLLLLRGAGRRTAVPFGPWLLGGAWIATLAGGGIWTAYLRMTGLACRRRATTGQDLQAWQPGSSWSRSAA